MGRVPEWAIQPEVAAMLLFSTSVQKTSRLTGSTGLASKGRAKRATWFPIHWVRGVGAGHEKGRTHSKLSRVQCPLLYTMPRGSPEVTTLSNTIDYELKSTDFWNRPFPYGLTQLNQYFGIYYDF